MAKKKGFSISLPGIIFMVVVYNFIFDDNDKNEVEIVENNTPVIEETVDDTLKDIKKDLKGVAEDAKKAFTQLKKDVTKELQSKEKPPHPEPEEKVEEETVVVEKETAPPPLPNPEDTGMKKL